MYYSPDLIEQVLESNNIVDVISEYVKLTKKGSVYVGLCPFHNEKTPSFTVTDNGDKRMFYCFGCHAGGSAMTFLMKHENITYTEAIEALAERGGVKLPKPNYSNSELAKIKKKEHILEINKEAALYFNYLLRSSRGQQGYNYLTERGLSDETIKKFGLGYSDKYKDDLFKYLKNKRFSDELIKNSGLCRIKENGSYDYFFNRVMFPIIDERNKVVGFGGRVMGEGEPKYLNSPETECFIKREMLFGLNLAKKHKGRDFILCEGYMDVIALHQAGFDNAVASLGTAFTEGHAMKLKKYASTVYISYDSDTAGRTAALRAIPMLKQLGLYVKIVDLSPYKDPDELIKSEGAEEYKKRIKNARNSFLFEIDELSKNFDLSDPDQKTAFYNELARRLGSIIDEIERENYLQAVCREYNIDQGLLRNKTKDMALKLASGSIPSHKLRLIKTGVNSRDKKAATALYKSQQLLIYYIANFPQIFKKIETVLSVEDFTFSPMKEMAQMLWDQLKNGQVNMSLIISQFEDADEQSTATKILCDGPEGKTDNETVLRAINDYVINIMNSRYEDMIKTESDRVKVLELRKKQEEIKKLKLF